MSDFATRLRAMLEKATPGPWGLDMDDAETEGRLIGPGGKGLQLRDARLTVELRNHAEAILALVEAEMICHGLRDGDDLEAEVRALEALKALDE